MDNSALKSPARATTFALATLFASLCLWPHLGRLRYPSLYGDDVVRIASERITGTPRLLFRPFNEHMAPLFEALTGVCWQLSFDRLTHAAVVLTWASYLPFLIILPVFFHILRKETGSLTAALVATAAFSISWLHVETIDWFSASSFMWALVGTLVAWNGAARAAKSLDDRSAFLARLVAAIAAGLAPATSAIGLIAGPLASLRGLAGREPRRLKNIAAPWIGTIVYIVICLFHHYGNHVVANVAKKGNLRLGSLAIGLAPVDVLIPALFGVGNLHGKVAESIVVATTIGLTATAICWACRSRFRAVVLGGLALILGGYVMTYLVRTSFLRVEGVLDTQRYHLFPQLGLCFIVAALLGSLALVKRLDDRPKFAWTAAIAAALLLNMTHDQTIRSRSNFYRYPDQMKALAALDRVGAICRANRIPRAQVLRAFDPVLTKWFPYEGFNQLDMLPPTLDTTVLTDDEARSLILQSLDPDEREGFLGGMDASKYVRFFANLGPTETVAAGKKRKLFRVREIGPGRYVSEGWPSYVEYDIIMREDAKPPRFLKVVGGDSCDFMLPSWNAGDDNWSESRQARVKVSRERVEKGWALPLSSLPHWRLERSRRVRIGIQTPGPIRLDSVELAR